MDDFNDLYLLSRVVEAGGFTAAERETGIPKSRLSRRIAALEERLGARLLNRSSRSFSVTPVGDLVYQHARTMVAEAEAAAEAVRETLAEPSGLVRISAPVLLGEMLLAGLLAEFALHYPRVHLALDHSNRFVDLAADRFDLAIRVASGQLESSGLIARRIGASAMAVVASPGLLEQEGIPNRPHDLKPHLCLAVGTADIVRPWQFRIPGTGALPFPVGSVTMDYPVNPRFVADNVAAVREAAIRGLGYAQLSSFACAQALAEGRLREVLRDWAPPPATVYAVYLSRRGVTSAVRTLIDFIRERMANQGLA